MKIIIDCGHGGKDSGAIGIDIIEKDYVLEIGRLLKNELSQYNCDVLMTRTDDTFLSLDDRTTLSNKNNCDLFISIHCNSFINDNANGFESFSYNGNEIQKKIHNDIIKNIKIKDRGIKVNSAFYVLRKTKCKAVLLELGFITNKEDSKLLNDNKYLFAHTISKSIAEHYNLQTITSDTYCVQVGSFKNKENAINLKNKLIAEGYDAFIVKK